MSAAPGDRIGRFALVRRVGAGGMGEVWEAHDPELDRSVAIKLLRADDGHARLAREARAMARLTHPAVITIYDVGDDDGQVWIAMELATGGTLRQWLQKPRHWREIVAAFAVAGRGLAAAHAVGLVHRDFKPDNVLVRSTGQMVVADFGLARAGHEPGLPAAVRDATPVSGDDATVPGGGAPRDGAVLGTGPTATGATAAGEIVGTPPYMAPEQHLGRAIDPRADQFAFAAALWEAVYRQRAFEQPASGDWALSIVHDRRRPPPREARVPRWLRAALDRGLATEREARFPSMDAMVAVLERGLHRRRRIAVAAVLLGAVVSTAALTVVLRPSAAAEAPCTAAPARMRDVWDPARRAEVQARFAASGAPFAAEAFDRVAAALDARRDAWIAMHTEACRATHVDGAQSPALLDRRMECLEDRRTELDAVIEALVRIDPPGMNHAGEAVAALPALDSCADPDVVWAFDTLPADPAQRREAESLYAELARGRALGNLGHHAEARVIVERVLAAARRLGQDRRVAQALYYLAADSYSLGDLADARTGYEAAAIAAAEARVDDVAAIASVELIGLLIENGDIERADALVHPAEAAVRRSHNRPPNVRSELTQMRGLIAMQRGDLQGARVLLEEAVVQAQRDAPDDSSALGQALSNLATVLTQLGDHGEAVALRTRALEVIERGFGRKHPAYGEGLAELGQAQRSAGDLPAALASLRAALPVIEDGFGAGSPNVALALQGLGNAESDAGNNAAAIAALERAVAIHERNASAQFPTALAALAVIKIGAGDEAGAIADYQRAMPAMEAQLGKDHFVYAIHESNHASLLACSAAVPLLDHAIAVLTEQVGADSEYTADARHNRAACDRKQR